MGLLDGILEALLGVFTLGMSNLSAETQWLMRLFIGLELVTAAAFWFWAQESVVTLLSFKFVRVGLFAMFVLQWPFLVSIFLDTMLWVGTRFSGEAMSVAEFRQPSRFFSAGFRATEPLFIWVRNVSAAGWTSVLINLANIILLLIAALGIWAAFLLVSLHILIALVMFWLSSAFLLIFIPFGVFGPTGFLAERSMGAVIAGAVRLGMMATILGISFPLMSAWALPTPTLGVDPSVRQAFTFAGAAIGVFLLNWVAPAFGASLFEGGPVLSGQGLLTGMAGVGARGAAMASGTAGLITGAADVAIKGTSKLVNSAKGEKHG
jgi:type IV secretion system protein TrbL